MGKGIMRVRESDNAYGRCIEIRKEGKRKCSLIDEV